MEYVSFSLNDILDDVADQVRAQLGGPDGGEFHLVVEEPRLALTGDPAALRQALLGLIGHLFDAVGPAKIIAVADMLDSAPDRGQRIIVFRLTVFRDGNAGLTMDEASNLLRIFAGNAPAPEDRTDGIRELADRLGGSIAIASEPGNGFAVSFTAEFGSPGAAAGDFTVRTGLGPARDPSAEIRMPKGLERIRGARILLAEDHPVNQNLTREILVHVGCEVDVAEDGQQTVDAVRERPGTYDAVIMDVQMPIMDGFGATRAIRGELAEADLPIIAMTANVLGDERERCLDAGMNDYVPKPIHIPDLYAALIRCIKPGARAQADSVGSVSAGGADVSTASGSAGALPSSMPEIDVDSGLARAMGNRELYAGLLAQFAKGNETLGEAVDAAVGAGDFDKARFLVHGLASTAGNIGADALYASASAFEKAIVAQSDDIGRLGQAFQARLEAALEAIREAGITTQSKLDSLGQRDAPLDREAAGQLAARFIKMLDDQDMGVQKHLDELLGCLVGQGHDEQLKRLEASLDTLDFPEAREILEEICKDILA